MRITDFHWQDHIIGKVVAEHGIDPEDVEDAIANEDPRPYVFRSGRDRYTAYTQAESGQYILVVFALESTATARIITAREMTDNEKSAYRKYGGH